MSRNKKTIMIVTLVLGFVLLTVGVSFALMNYNRIGSNQQVVLGDIWMSYEETTILTIEDALPGSDYSNYFEFTISGKNTYTKKDIYYDFSLVRGDLPEGKTEDNRIPDKYLKFKLVSVDSSNQETVIFTDSMYESLENQRIYVETIKKNTENKINRKYRLYMTIDNSLEIGNLETAVFTLDEWESAFASVKLNVTGDFSEKIVLSYEDCFETNVLEDGTLEITNYIGIYDPTYHWANNYNPLCTSDVIIPSTIDGVSVTKIGDSAFYGRDLTSVEIPNSVTTIGRYAFHYNELTSIDIPSSVTTIGESAFSYNYLTDIKLTSNVTHIGGGAFNNNSLPDTKATFYSRKDDNGDGIAEIDYTTVVSYGGLNKEPIIPDSVTTIGRYAYYESQLTSVEIPNSVTLIGESAFSFNQLSSVEIPNSVKIIESSAFEYNGLTSIVISNGVTTIGFSAFSFNQLSSVEIPNSVTTIDDYAFQYNELTSIVIPDSVKYIGNYAFMQNSLSEIILGSSVEEIGYEAFPTHCADEAGNNRIEKVINKSRNEFDWDSIFDVESVDDTNYIVTGTYKFYYEEELVEILIQASASPEPTPESCFTTTSIDSTSVGIIGYDTSCGTDIIIPSKINEKNVTTIVGLQSSGLTSVVIPNTVTTIEYNAFYNNQLTSVVIPDSVTSIETFAFAYNYLEKVVLGSSVENISSAAFPTYSHSYSGSNMITNVVNKSGNSFDWGSVFGLSYDGNNTFATGTYYLYGNQTIEITGS